MAPPRLDRERELICDEAAVALGADPLAYARLLLDLARAPGALLPFTSYSRSAPLMFLERRTVVARIERLLEDNMSRTISPVPYPASRRTGHDDTLLRRDCWWDRSRTGAAVADH